MREQQEILKEQMMKN